MSYELLSNANYYSIDDILCEATLVPATFTHDCIGLGHLESIDSEDIAANTKCDIPYWLMQYLAMHSHISLQLPARLFGVRFIESVLADTQLYTDLMQRCVYYYELGIKYFLLNEDTTRMSQLRSIYHTRYNTILHRSATQRSNDHNAFINKLCHSETQLFDIKHYVAICIAEWRNRHSIHARAGQLNHTINVLQNITNIAAKQQAAQAKQADQTSRPQKQASKFGAGGRAPSNVGENENSYSNKRQRA